MKNKILLFLVVVLIPLTIISFRKKTNFSMEENKIIINYKGMKEDLDSYVYHVVSSEVPALFEDESIKAQILATRTYTYYKYLSNNNYVFDNNDQAYKNEEELKEYWKDNYEKYSNKIKELINITKNEIITYNNQPIESLYFSMSNGYTEDVLNVFNEERDYLKSVESPYEKELKNFKNNKEITIDELCEKLDVNKPVVINNIIRDNSNRVKTININGKEYTGIDIRKKLNLKSTDFNIEINDKVIITTKGNGHGVGMSQYGANEMAKQGYNYKDIIKYYYKNVEIEKIMNK